MAGASASLAEARGEANLGEVALVRVDDLSSVAELDDQPPGEREPAGGALDAFTGVGELSVDAEQSKRCFARVVERGPDVPAETRVVHHLEQARLDALGRVGLDPERRGDLVGGEETDAVDVEGEPVGRDRHDSHRSMAVAPHDPGRERRARAVRLQEDHHVAKGALLLPGLGDGFATFVPQPFDLAQPVGLVVEYAQRLEPERRHDARGHLGTDALDEARRQVLLEPREGLGDGLDERLGADLFPVPLVLLELTAHPNPGTHRGRGKRAYHRDPLGPTLDGDLDDAKARLGALEGDPFDHPLDHGLGAHGARDSSPTKKKGPQGRHARGALSPRLTSRRSCT